MNEQSKIFMQGISVDELIQLVREVVRNEFADIKSNQEEKLLSPEEARKFFVPAISKSTLHTWTERGLIPCHYMSCRKFYKLSEILSRLETLKKYKNHLNVA